MPRNAPFDRNPDGMVYEKNLVGALSHSPFIKVTLDTGHVTAFAATPRHLSASITTASPSCTSRTDCVARRIETTKTPPRWGKGDAPLVQVLQLMRDQRYAFPACIESSTRRRARRWKKYRSA
jgi:hypothetical protein